MTYEDALAALADPTRRKIFESLHAGPKSVSDIAKVQPVSRPAVSQHLKILESARLVQAAPAGNRRIYRHNQDGLQALKLYLDQFWTDVLDAYSAEITKRVEQMKD